MTLAFGRKLWVRCFPKSDGRGHRKPPILYWGSQEIELTELPPIVAESIPSGLDKAEGVAWRSFLMRAIAAGLLVADIETKIRNRMLKPRIVS